MSDDQRIQLGVRCPRCGRKLAESLEGVLSAWCRRCDRVVTVEMHVLTTTDRRDIAITK